MSDINIPENVSDELLYEWIETIRNMHHTFSENPTAIMAEAILRLLQDRIQSLKGSAKNEI